MTERNYTQQRTLEPFNSVSISGVFNLLIQQNGNESIKLSSNSDILNDIETIVESGRLEIRPKREIKGFSEWFKRRGIVDYVLEIKDISMLTVSGGGTVSCDNLSTQKLEIITSGAAKVKMNIEVNDLHIKTSGAADIHLEGKTDSQEVVHSGAGNYDTSKLVSKSANISLSGAGKVTVNASESLNANLSGIGTINYLGNPQVTQNVSGLGKISKIN